jgi:transcriptional regulator GlxA family with amidase domain
MIAGSRPSTPKRVAVLAFDGVVLGDLSVPIEIFGRALDPSRRKAYEVRVFSEEPSVETEHVRLLVPWRLSSLSWAGTVIIPGVSDPNRPISPRLVASIQRAAARGVRIASICSGAFLLAATGLLDGRRATTHWMAASELAQRHPAVEVDADVLYVDNGEVLTSAGAAAGLDLCLHLVRRDFGARVAADAARAAVMPLERAGGQAQFIVHPPPASAESLQPILSWMEAHLERDQPTAVIAKRAAMSTRTLSRRFREQTGSSPAQWLIRARVRRAQQLLESGSSSIEEVAAQVGFGTAAILREHFNKLVGTSPQAYRRAFKTDAAAAGGAGGDT